MPDISKTWSTRFSRRSLLLEGAVRAGGVATVLATAAIRPAQAAKMSQESVNYQGSPKGSQQCSNCKLFTAPSACQSVDGTISPNGWCSIYQMT
jgi:High potential iron-sulfur protein